MSNNVHTQKISSLDNNYKLCLKSIYNSPFLKQINVNLPTKMSSGSLRQNDFFVYGLFYLFFCKTPILSFRRIKQKDSKFVGVYYIKLLLSDKLEISNLIYNVFLNNPNKMSKLRCFSSSFSKSRQYLFQAPLSLFSATRLDQVLKLGSEFPNNILINVSVIYWLPSFKNIESGGSLSTLPYFWING